MKTNKQALEKRVKQLEEQLIDSKIKKHTKDYIHVPVCNLWALLGTLLSGALTYGNWLVLTSLWQFLSIGAITEASPLKPIAIQTYQFGILPIIILQYIFVALTILSIGAITKDGYDKLKSIDEGGLIGGLIFGLIGGLIVGLIFGLIVGLIVGLSKEYE